MSIVGICAPVIAVLIALVDYSCTRCSQQPCVGLQCCLIGVLGTRLTGTAILFPLIPFIISTGVSATCESGYVMTANEGNHGRSFDILILASCSPIIQMLVVHVARSEHVVYHSMIEDEISLSIERIRADVTVDCAILLSIFF